MLLFKEVFINSYSPTHGTWLSLVLNLISPVIKNLLELSPGGKRFLFIFKSISYKPAPELFNISGWFKVAFIDLLPNGAFIFGRDETDFVILVF